MQDPDIIQGPKGNKVRQGDDLVITGDPGLVVYVKKDGGKYSPETLDKNGELTIKTKGLERVLVVDIRNPPKRWTTLDIAVTSSFK